jgi:2,4-dienoyl-CoA reductase-like NADH-dependent reductase (Old Yellow Enzyme family)
MIWECGMIVLSLLQKDYGFIKSQNAVPGIQLAHAGRKGSTYTRGKAKMH